MAHLTRAVRRPRRSIATYNLWAKPPPIFVDRCVAAAADNLSMALLLCTYFVAIFDRWLQNLSLESFRIEQNFFGNLWKKYFPLRHAASNADFLDRRRDAADQNWPVPRRRRHNDVGAQFYIWQHFLYTRRLLLHSTLVSRLLLLGPLLLHQCLVSRIWAARVGAYPLITYDAAAIPSRSVLCQEPA